MMKNKAVKRGFWSATLVDGDVYIAHESGKYECSLAAAEDYGRAEATDGSSKRVPDYIIEEAVELLNA